MIKSSLIDQMPLQRKTNHFEIQDPLMLAKSLTTMPEPISLRKAITEYPCDQMWIS